MSASMANLWEFFKYQLPAKCSGRFISPVWDTGGTTHGVAVLPHADVWQLHGEYVEVSIRPLRPLKPDEIEALPRVPSPVCPISAGNADAPPPYQNRHFLYLPQQVQGATLGRTPQLEWYAGWLCEIGIGRVNIEKLSRGDMVDLMGVPG